MTLWEHCVFIIKQKWGGKATCSVDTAVGLFNGYLELAGTMGPVMAQCVQMC